MRKIMPFALAALLVVAVAAPTRAQEANAAKKPTVYTYVSFWVIPRAQWGEMAKSNASDQDLMRRFLADGTILNFGYAENLIHTPDGPTHVEWFSAASEGNIFKVLQAEYSSPDQTAPVLAAATRHWDELLETDTYNGNPGALNNAFLSVANFVVKPGDMRAFNDLIKARVVPVLDKLVSTGDLAGYEVYGWDFVNDKPGSVALVMTTPSAEADNRVNAAFEAAFGKDAAIGPALATLTRRDQHVDELYLVRHMESK